MEKKESVTTKTDKLTSKAVPTPTFLNKEQIEQTKMKPENMQ